MENRPPRIGAYQSSINVRTHLFYWFNGVYDGSALPFLPARNNRDNIRQICCRGISGFLGNAPYISVLCLFTQAVAGQEIRDDDSCNFLCALGIFYHNISLYCSSITRCMLANNSASAVGR